MSHELRHELIQKLLIGVNGVPCGRRGTIWHLWHARETEQLVSCVTRERTLSGWRVLSDEGQEFVLCLLESDVAVPDSLRQAWLATQTTKHTSSSFRRNRKHCVNLYSPSHDALCTSLTCRQADHLVGWWSDLAPNNNKKEGYSFKEPVWAYFFLFGGEEWDIYETLEAGGILGRDIPVFDRTNL